jgi:hypothetical protein
MRFGAAIQLEGRTRRLQAHSTYCLGDQISRWIADWEGDCGRAWEDWPHGGSHALAPALIPV